MAPFVIPLIIAVGALVSHVFFGALHKPEQVATQPLAVVTGWGLGGVGAWAIYAVTMACAGIAYWRAIVRARERPADDDTQTIPIRLATAIALVASLAFAFLFSSDVYAYAAYGAIVAGGENPYVYRTFPPAHLVDDTWTRAIGFEWPSLPACVYGPAFLAIARTIVVLTQFDLAHTLLALRILEMAAFIALVAVVARAVPERGTLLATTIGLNPVVISTVAEGHYDALVALGVALAVLVAQRRARLGGFLAGFTVLLKATGAVAALALAYATRSSRMLWWALAGIVVAIGAQVVATQLAGGFQTVAPTDFVGSKWAAAAIAVRGVIALALAMRVLRCAARDERAAALANAALVIWALYPQDYPWYGVWLLPLAAFTLERREGPVLIVLTFTSTLRYLSDAYGFAPAAPWLELGAFLIPLTGLVL